MYFNTIKAMYNRPVANMILNGKKTENISSEARNETGV
jgi:hypothetical protein